MIHNRTCKLSDSSTHNPSDHVGLSRLGQGLGADACHCMHCNACMALSEFPRHKCRDLSTCPVCTEYLFDSAQPYRVRPHVSLPGLGGKGGKLRRGDEACMCSFKQSCREHQFAWICMIIVRLRATWLVVVAKHASCYVPTPCPTARHAVARKQVMCQTQRSAKS